jgi:hypothetical protein
MTKYHAKLERLADTEGYDDVDQLFECRALDSTVPGICMEHSCDFTADHEPDQDKGMVRVLRQEHREVGARHRGVHLMANHAKVRELNDAFRKGERPELGRIMITSGARELVAAWPLGEILLVHAVRKFEAFDEGNDPWCEHDYGSFEHAGEMCFFKFDYMDKALEYGSEDPADESQTTRVLTIALLSEYCGPSGPLFNSRSGTKAAAACLGSIGGGDEATSLR